MGQFFQQSGRAQGVPRKFSWANISWPIIGLDSEYQNCSLNLFRLLKFSLENQAQEHQAEVKQEHQAEIVQEHKAEENVGHGLEESRDAHPLGHPPAPVHHEEAEVEKREHYIQECLGMIQDVGEEGTIHNMEDNVEILAVKPDLQFE